MDIAGDFTSSSNAANVRIPGVVCLKAETPSNEKKIQGLQIEGAFQREGDKVFLELKLSNKSQKKISDFAIKFDSNPFKLAPTDPILTLQELNPGASGSAKVPCGFNGETDGQTPGFPFTIQVAFKTNFDIFVFFIPCSLSIMMIPNTALSPNDYQLFSGKGYPAIQKKLEVEVDTNEKIKKLFANNNINFVGSRTNSEGVEMVSYSTKLTNGMPVTVDTILDKNSNPYSLNMNITAPHESIHPLFHQAIGFILKQR